MKRTLDADQAAAVCGLLAGGNGLVTGPAGSGKSHVIGALGDQIPLTVCSTTGMAAMLVGGTTIDRLFGFSRDTWRVRNAATTEKNMRCAADTIVIDEGPTMGANMANIVGSIAKRYNKRLILVGDFAQTAPVNDAWATQTRLFKDMPIHRLTCSHRQGAGQESLLGALTSLRQGIVTDAVRDAFNPCLVDTPPDDDAFVRLFGTNRIADRYNQSRLDALCPLDRQRQLVTRYESHGKRRATAEESDRRCNESRLAHRDHFAVGARVVITSNDRDDGAYVNGDAGTIVAFTGKSQVTSVVVKRERDHALLDIAPIERQVVNGVGEHVGTATGFPLKLGWALTIHRSQGLTLDKVFVDMGSICQFPDDSRHGLAYVALSRSRSIEGLKIANWRDDAVYCHPSVKSFL